MTRDALVAQMVDTIRKLLIDPGPPIPADFAAMLWFRMFPEATSAERHAAMAIVEAEVDARLGTRQTVH